jgi:hypothetical protein
VKNPTAHGESDTAGFRSQPADPQHPRSVCEIGFSVGDLDTVHSAALRAGVSVIAPPYQKPGHDKRPIVTRMGILSRPHRRPDHSVRHLVGSRGLQGSDPRDGA